MKNVIITITYRGFFLKTNAMIYNVPELAVHILRKNVRFAATFFGESIFKNVTSKVPGRSCINNMYINVDM
jgi:hypothetical protein